MGAFKFETVNDERRTVENAWRAAGIAGREREYCLCAFGSIETTRTADPFSLEFLQCRGCAEMLS